MSPGDYNAINAALRRYDRLAGLDDARLNELAGEALVRGAERGACLLELGCNDPHQLFLLEGEIELVAGDGAAHSVRHTDVAATGPISRLRPSRYRVTARSHVRYLLVEQRLLDECSPDVPLGKVLVEEALAVSSPSELLDDSASHPLMFDVFHDLNRGCIVVPSDPEVAIRVGRSLNSYDASPTRLGDALAICPAMALKVLRAAKAIRGQRAPLISIKAAVERLGPERTYSLVVNCALRETLRTRSTVVRQRMRGWWERTIRVSAISSMLAGESERFDPEYARLIGLLHGIAEPVLLGYADRHADLADAVALDNVVYGNRAELGRILLTMWDLPHVIVDAANLCNHWGYDHAGDADYTDILLVAQWHAMIGGKANRRIPAIEHIPAFARLGLDQNSSHVSVTIVDAAEEALERAEALLKNF